MTDKRYNDIQRDVFALIATFGGINELDSVDEKNHKRIVGGYGGEIGHRHGIAGQASRNHVKKAMRRMRSPDFDPMENVKGRGGDRRSKKFKNK